MESPLGTQKVITAQKVEKKRKTNLLDRMEAKIFVKINAKKIEMS